MFLISNFLFSDNSEYHAIISIPELNFTLSERNKDASLSMFNNYTYNLPYSPYIGFNAYSLKFEVLGSHEVHKCLDEKAQHCEQAPNNDDWGNWHEVAYEVLIEPNHEIWYLSHRRPAKAQASLRICAVSPEPSLFAHVKYGSRRRV